MNKMEFHVQDASEKMSQWILKRVRKTSSLRVGMTKSKMYFKTDFNILNRF